MVNRVVSKIERAKFYLTPSGALVRTLRVDEKHNRVIFKRYDEFVNDVLELDLAQQIWTPMFKIADAASIVSRKPSTLRKYERLGIIPSARQFDLNAEGTKKLRFYSWHDILDLVECINRIRPPGRPSKFNVPSNLNKEHVKKRLSRRFENFEQNRI
jgi:hypothetical protein